MEADRRKWPSAISIMLLIALGAGCTQVRHHGDAKLMSRPTIYGPINQHRSYRLEFPPVPLSRTGTYHFRIRNLPPVISACYGWVIVPEADCAARADTAWPWKETVVTLEFASPEGKSISKAAYRLGERPFFQRMGGGCQLWVSIPEAPREPDFDLLVTVETPSKRKSDRLELWGLGATYSQPED